MKVLSLLVTLFPAGFAAPEETDIEELLSKMRKVYRETKSASFVTQTDFDERGEKLLITLTADYQAPNKMKVVFEGLPSGLATLYCDGRTVTIVGDKDMRRKLDYSLDSLGRSLFANLETLSFFDWKRQLSTEVGGNMKGSTLKVVREDWQGKNWIVLEEHAPQQKVDVRYFVDPETYLIWRTIATMIGEKSPFMDARLTKLELDKTFDDSHFDPPK